MQALIIMDFLLSLSAKAKEKLAAAKVHNKSVMYLDQRLSDEEVCSILFPRPRFSSNNQQTKWATDMK
ncbi:hypothetical protein IMZ48_38755, partial [Candidatus Bathyarchaeota archaeon]|nr:hypothetical protein [Candidatus Bathyarchaeota archaeon]